MHSCFSIWLAWLVKDRSCISLSALLAGLPICESLGFIHHINHCFTDYTHTKDNSLVMPIIFFQNLDFIMMWIVISIELVPQRYETKILNFFQAVIREGFHIHT
ncbi:hypothetical protein ACOSQ2_019775 [Xanthoceras sorbifolium]